MAQIYQEVIAITEEYLGPASERFLARHITFHLNKSPENPTPEDLPTLIEWTKVTLGQLTEDRTMVDDYITKMNRLAHR